MSAEPPRFCGGCGAPLASAARFCEACGALVAVESADPLDLTHERGPRIGKLALLGLAIMAAGGAALALHDGGGGKSTASAQRNPATSLAVGGSSACRIGAGGQVMCWGNNSYGNLGVGTVSGSARCPGPIAVKALCSTRPVKVRGLRDVTAISNGGWVTCAIVAGGSVACWGDNRTGALGSGETAGPHTCSPPGGESQPCSPVPIGVSGIKDAVAVESYGGDTCVLLATGQVKCWGDNRHGGLGIGSFTGPATCSLGACSPRPLAVSGIENAKAISADCAVVSSGSVYCWGDNSAGGLGSGDLSGPVTCSQGGEAGTPCSPSPVRVHGITNATALATGGGQTCALLRTGAIDCWGYNGGGQLGEGTSEGPQTCTSDQQCSTVPVQVIGIHDATAITAGGGFTCAMRSGGLVACWGNNVSGQLGDGTTTSRAVPQNVPGIAGAKAISAGDTSVCALMANGVKCWGDNSSGELGDATIDNRFHPALVKGQTVLRAPRVQPRDGALSIKSSCANWYAASIATRDAFAAIVRPSVSLTSPVPKDAKGAEAFMYGFIYAECDRAKKAGIQPTATTMTQVLAADFGP